MRPRELRVGATFPVKVDVRIVASGAVNDEIAAIEAALEETGGALGRSAELLGMGRTTLWRKLRQLGIKGCTS